MSGGSEMIAARRRGVGQLENAFHLSFVAPLPPAADRAFRLLGPRCGHAKFASIGPSRAAHTTPEVLSDAKTRAMVSLIRADDLHKPQSSARAR